MIVRSKKFKKCPNLAKMVLYSIWQMLWREKIKSSEGRERSCLINLQKWKKNFDNFGEKTSRKIIYFFQKNSFLLLNCLQSSPLAFFFPEKVAKTLILVVKINLTNFIVAKYLLRHVKQFQATIFKVAPKNRGNYPESRKWRITNKGKTSKAGENDYK